MQYGAATATFVLTGSMLQCDIIPPPVVLQSPWDKRGTKTDEPTVVCNLPVKAK